MDLRLLHSKAFKNGNALVSHGGAEISGEKEVSDIRESPVRLGILGPLDIETSAKEMVPFLASHFEAVALKGQALENLSQFFNRISGIEQCSDHHVSADAGKTIEIGNLHPNTKIIKRVRVELGYSKTNPKGHHENTKGRKHERIIMIAFFVLS